MADFEQENKREDFFRRLEKRHQQGRVWTGIFLLVIGAAALMRNYSGAPEWLFTWETFLIALGLFMGLRHQFRGGAWFILMLIGGVFLVNNYFLHGNLNGMIWPIALIALGIFFIFRPRSSRCRDWIEKKKQERTGSTFMNEKETYSQEDLIDTTSIFGGVKKNILSKKFKGGDITNIFGGTDLNLSQADLEGKAIIDITTVFGGTKLTVPSNWTVQSEAVTIFGGIEDKRSLSTLADNPEKILVLKGTIIFGGIEIKSF
jgi:predicted membrane protein